MEPFADRLCEAIRVKGTPVMVGIDPQWDLLPPEFRTASFEQLTAESPATVAYREFSLQILDAVADLVPVVKFQMAFFEALGPHGLMLLADIATAARDRGLLVILDGKRNDIGSSAAGYAEAYLGRPAGVLSDEQFKRKCWHADALTVNPYLGPEGLTPFVDVAKRENRGVFVLVRTSNPGAGLLQDCTIEDLSIYDRVADWVEEWSKATVGSSGFGVAGAVVGATVPEQLAAMRRRMPSVVLLVPGYGAQGAGAEDAAGAFHSSGLGAIVNNSRGILYAYREVRFRDMHWKDAAIAATREMIGALATKTPAGRFSR